MSDLEFIVTRLRAAPFNQTMSLVQFDERSPPERIRLLNDVLAQVSPDMNVDLRQEVPENTAMRIIGFLRMLRYKPANMELDDAKNALMAGEKDIINNMLIWVLKRFEELKKKAYIAKYVYPIDVPPEYMQDRMLADLANNYKEMQNQFKEVHKQVDKARQSGFSPNDIKREIASLETDKEQLTAKIERVRRRVQGMPNFAHQLSVVAALRKEQEEETALAERFKEQRNLLHHAEGALQRVTERYNDLRATLGAGDVENLVRKTREQANVNRTLSTERLPQLIEERKRLVAELTAIIDQPAISEAEVGRLQSEARALNEEIKRRMEARASSEDASKDKLLPYRQQARAITRKKEGKTDELNALMEEKVKMEHQLRQMEQEIERETGQKVIYDDDLVAFKNNLRGKAVEYKRMQAEEKTLRTEFAILSRTEAILKDRSQNVGELLAELEAKRGVSGYMRTQEGLQDAATKRAELDSKKGETMEDLSRIVKQVAFEERRKATELEPLMAETKAMRQRRTEVETRWNEKKTLYDSINAGLSSNRIKLESDLAKVAGECADLESEYHILQGRILTHNVMLRRAKAEQAYVTQHTPVSKTMPSYKDAINKQIEAQVNLNRTLRQNKKRIQETHDPNMKQIVMINDVKKLLALKTKILKETLKERKESAADTSMDIRPMAQRNQDVNMMVIDR